MSLFARSVLPVHSEPNRPYNEPNDPSRHVLGDLPALFRCAFGNKIDYVQLVKIYGETPESAKGRYSPADCTGIKKKLMSGSPDEKHISTSDIERSNLTMRMHNRRFTRLTNAFSKKFESHVHMVALYTVFYNWVRIHKTLRITPAMAAGLTDRVWGMEDVVGLMDAVARKPGRPKTYIKRLATTC